MEGRKQAGTVRVRIYKDKEVIMNTNKEELQETLDSFEFKLKLLMDRYAKADEIQDPIEAEEAFNKVKSLVSSELSRVEREAKIAIIKKDIRYHTLKARFQRTFLGGEEDARPTKLYVKTLKRQLATLTHQDTSKESKS